MRTEDAFRMLIDKCEHLSVARADAQREKERDRRESFMAATELRTELEETRRSLLAHRTALKGAKVKKLPVVPKHFAEWSKPDDIPF